MKILHLFPHLLSLYGEYGNVAVLKKVLEENGHSVEVVPCEDGAADYSEYSLIYIGSGTEDNLLVALDRLMSHQESIRSSIADGALWLATGNAMTLFGRTVFRRDEETPALGIFSYQTTIDDTIRYLGDVLTADAYGRPMIGFINTSSAYSGVEGSFLQLLLGNKLGNDKQSAAEGLQTGNFFATQLIGPVLVKNPHFLKHIADILTGESIALDSASNLCKAYEVSLKELRTRLDNKR